LWYNRCMEHPGYIYRIIAPGSNSVYVGQSTQPVERFRQHRRAARRGDHDNPAVQRFLRKHENAEMHFWPVLDMDAEEIADEALCREMGFCSLNLIPCGGAVPTRSADVCAKISATMRGRKASPEAIEKMRVARTGFRHTPESRAKMRESQAKVAVPRGMSGKKHTPETKAKIGATKIRNKTTCPRGHIYSHVDANGKRACRPCLNAASKRFYAKKVG
jgi:predicted GIY-YIG superfamily endonuclease